MMVSKIGYGLLSITLVFAGWTYSFADTTSLWNTETNHFFIDGGSSLYYMSNPEVKIASNSAGNPLAEISDTGYAPMYHLGIGYYFCNCGNNCMAKLLGNENRVEFSVDYLDKHASTSRSNLGEGLFYFIDGSGPATLPIPLSHFHLTAEHEYIGTKLYMSGVTESNNSRLTFNPFGGLVYTNLNEYYDFSITYPIGRSTVDTDAENYTVKTNYFGAGGGEQANYSLTPYTSLFTRGELQLLYARSNLYAFQDTKVGAPGWDYSVTNHNVRATYRALVSTGVQYQFLNALDSPQLAWSVGGDLWGDNPDVVVPRNTGKKIYINPKRQLDGFTQLQIIWPFY